jgi:hypothetical protein
VVVVGTIVAVLPGIAVGWAAGPVVAVASPQAANNSITIKRSKRIADLFGYQRI